MLSLYSTTLRGTLYIPYNMQNVHCTFSIICRMYTVHSVQYAECTLYIPYNMQDVHCTFRTICRMYTVHSVQYAECTLYIQYNLQNVHCTFRKICRMYRTRQNTKRLRVWNSFNLFVLFICMVPFIFTFSNFIFKSLLRPSEDFI